MVIVKIILIFTLLALLLRLKVPFSLSILVGGMVLGIGFNLGIPDIGNSVLETLQQKETILLALIVGIILVLSELLQASGQLTALSGLIVETFGLHRWTYTILPAIVGLLPMPGGALFTAPLMDDASNESIPSHKKTLINYWFRHIWEYAWPLYPGLVLAAGLSKVNLNTLSLFQSPFILISLISGIVFIFPGIKVVKTLSPQPIRAGVSNLFRVFINMLYLISPILVIIILFLIAGLDMLICISVGLLLAILNIVITRRLKIIGILRIVFAKVSVYQMIFIVITVLIFTGILRSSTLTTELTGFFNGDSGTRIPFVYILLSVIFLPLIVGLLTGLTVGFVGITFPIIFSTFITASGHGILPWVLLAYISGVSGVMLSPLHLCLVLSNQYYGSSLMKVYKYLIPIVLCVLASGIIFFLVI